MYVVLCCTCLYLFDLPENFFLTDIALIAHRSENTILAKEVKWGIELLSNVSILKVLKMSAQD